MGHDVKRSCKPCLTILVERVLGPVGGLWSADVVNVRLEGEDWGREDVGAAVAKATAFWHSLVARTIP